VCDVRGACLDGLGFGYIVSEECIYRRFTLLGWWYAVLAHNDPPMFELWATAPVAVTRRGAVLLQQFRDIDLESLRDPLKNRERRVMLRGL